MTLDDLHGEQLLLLEDGHCLRDQTLAVGSSMGAVENATSRATSLKTLRQMVAANAGVGLGRLRCHAREEIDAVDSGLVRTRTRLRLLHAHLAWLPHRSELATNTLHWHAAVSTVC